MTIYSILYIIYIYIIYNINFNTLFFYSKNGFLLIVICHLSLSCPYYDALIMNEERIYMRMPADIAAPRRAAGRTHAPQILRKHSRKQFAKLT